MQYSGLQLRILCIITRIPILTCFIIRISYSTPYSKIREMRNSYNWYEYREYGDKTDLQEYFTQLLGKLLKENNVITELSNADV